MDPNQEGIMEGIVAYETCEGTERWKSKKKKTIF